MEKNYVVNVKTSKGTIITARGDSAEELIANVNDLVAQGGPDAISTLEEAFTGVSAPRVLATDPVAIIQASLGGEVVPEVPAFAPKAPPAQDAPAGIDTVQDRWGSRWTYGRADAPICPNGPMVLKQGTNQAGKAYVGWFDPAGGPRWQGAKIASGDQTAPQFGVKV
jgi:hypothetical protein